MAAESDIPEDNAGRPPAGVIFGWPVWIFAANHRPLSSKVSRCQRKRKCPNHRTEDSGSGPDNLFAIWKFSQKSQNSEV